MSEMSKELRKSASKMLTIARDEDSVVVGFVIPKDLGEDFGWNLFHSPECSTEQAQDLIQTIADILKQPETPGRVN